MTWHLQPQSSHAILVGAKSVAILQLLALGGFSAYCGMNYTTRLKQKWLKKGEITSLTFGPCPENNQALDGRHPRGVNIIPFFILNCLLVLKSSLFFVLINAFMLKSLKILLWQPRCPEPFSDRGALFWFFTLIIKNPLCVLSHTHTPSGWMKYDQSINTHSKVLRVFLYQIFCVIFQFSFFFFFGGGGVYAFCYRWWPAA